MTSTGAYIFSYLLYMAVLSGAALYVWKYRKGLDEMYGMMMGMTFGTVAGLATGLFYALPSGDFVGGAIVGTVAGLLFGILLGVIGGPLGIMEGVMGAFMGGFMGSMTGQMARPFPLGAFSPVFAAIFLAMMAGITYAAETGKTCCAPAGGKPEAPERPKLVNPSGKFVATWTVVAAILLFASFAIDLSPYSAQGAQSTGTQSTALPASLRALTEEQQTQAVQKDGYQEASFRVTAGRYTPNVIVVKAGTPLRLNIAADRNAGCGTDIVFPDLRVRSLIPPGTSKTVEVGTPSAGNHSFSCSMGMFRGKIVAVG